MSGMPFERSTHVRAPSDGFLPTAGHFPKGTRTATVTVREKRERLEGSATFVVRESSRPVDGTCDDGGADAGVHETRPSWQAASESGMHMDDGLLVE